MSQFFDNHYLILLFYGSWVLTVYHLVLYACTITVCSDSEMEIEAEHYTNGVVESSSARIMNGTYKHEEILQPDDNSISNGVAGTSLHTNTDHTTSNHLFLWLCHFIYYLLWLLRIMRLSLVCLLPADEGCSNGKQLCGGNQAATERMIQFGRELQALNDQLCREYGKNATHKKMLQVYTHHV